MHRLYPRTSVEYEHFAPSGYPAKALFEKRSAIPALQSDALLSSPFPHRSLEDGLIFGDLPGIAAEHGRPETRRDILRTYTSAYTEEELHRETQLRNWSPFLRFVSLAANPGPLFEQWVGIELHKRLSYEKEGTLSYYRTTGGAEVDFIIEKAGVRYPIEVKWTENPTEKDARHLKTFMDDHRADHGYIVCRCQYPQHISDKRIIHG